MWDKHQSIHNSFYNFGLSMQPIKYYLLTKAVAVTVVETISRETDIALSCSIVVARLAVLCTFCNRKSKDKAIAVDVDNVVFNAVNFLIEQVLLYKTHRRMYDNCIQSHFIPLHLGAFLPEFIKCMYRLFLSTTVLSSTSLLCSTWVT